MADDDALARNAARGDLQRVIGRQFPVAVTGFNRPDRTDSLAVLIGNQPEIPAQQVLARRRRRVGILRNAAW